MTKATIKYTVEEVHESTSNQREEELKYRTQRWVLSNLATLPKGKEARAARKVVIKLVFPTTPDVYNDGSEGVTVAKRRRLQKYPIKRKASGLKRKRTRPDTVVVKAQVGGPSYAKILDQIKNDPSLKVIGEKLVQLIEALTGCWVRVSPVVYHCSPVTPVTTLRWMWRADALCSLVIGSEAVRRTLSSSPTLSTPSLTYGASSDTLTQPIKISAHSPGTSRFGFVKNK
ncbi:hypothetical protein J6590_009352 [Homalodisca vitripennis]|nr:hypothetical protein J6590_009352 [Homalodisca vitripennis]